MRIDRLLKNVTSIKLSGGIFAKTSRVLIVASIALTVLAYLANDRWVFILNSIIIFILNFHQLNRLLAFSNKNPEAAILDGANFLRHEEMKMASRDHTLTEQEVAKLTQRSSLEISDKSIEESNIPDKSDQRIKKSKGKERLNG